MLLDYSGTNSIWFCHFQDGPCDEHSYASKTKFPKPALEDQLFLVNDRIAQVQALARAQPSRKRKSALAHEVEDFLRSLPDPVSLSTCKPAHLLQFIALKDTTEQGRTQVHVLDCPFLGRFGIFQCGCPRRLSSAYLKRLIGNMRSVFSSLGLGDLWDEAGETGNPAAAQCLHSYHNVVLDEQAAAHVPVKQAPPMFPDKFKQLSSYLLRELETGSLNMRERFLLLRDRAFFLLQFFMGERGGDMSKLVIQEIYRLAGNQGLLIRQTFGKNRSDNVSVVPVCGESRFCAVSALDQYIAGALRLGIHIDSGYVFRRTTSDGRVLGERVSQPAINRRLKSYLSAIGIFQGETTHSIRGGCAILLKLSHSSDPEAMSHIGWKSQECWEHYSRSKSIESLHVAKTLSEAFERGAQLGAVYEFQQLAIDHLALAYP